MGLAACQHPAQWLRQISLITQSTSCAPTITAQHHRQAHWSHTNTFLLLGNYSAPGRIILITRRLLTQRCYRFSGIFKINTYGYCVFTTLLTQGLITYYLLLITGLRILNRSLIGQNNLCTKYLLKVSSKTLILAFQIFFFFFLVIIQNLSPGAIWAEKQTMHWDNSEYFSQYVLYNSPFTSFQDTSTDFINIAEFTAPFLATGSLKSLQSLAEKLKIKLTYQLLKLH